MTSPEQEAAPPASPNPTDSTAKPAAPPAPAPASTAPKPMPPEIGGPAGPEPTRFGDWERKGRVSDF
jgi:hypothetical protein